MIGLSRFQNFNIIALPKESRSQAKGSHIAFAGVLQRTTTLSCRWYTIALHYEAFGLNIEAKKARSLCILAVVS